MACACNNRKKVTYVWTDDEKTVVYATEIQAKAKVQRAGGSYEKVEG